MSMGAGVPQPDGVTIRYPVTINANAFGSAVFNFSGAMSAMPDLPRDGSTSSAGQPLICTAALAHYSKFGSLRLMDFLSTNNRTDTTWSTRPNNWLLQPYHAGSPSPYSWEFMVAFVNAVAAYPGSQLKNVFINIPGYVDQGYVASLATLLNTLGLTSSIELHIDRANEHWNGGSFTFFGSYMSSALAELNCLTNYGASTLTISSFTTDGTTLTFNTVNPITTYLPGASNGTNAQCVVVGGVGGFGLGTQAAPVTATVTGANSFTIPTALTATGTAQFNVVFNFASTLCGDGLVPNVYGASNKWYVRLLSQDQQTWSAIRPQDRFFMDTALYGGEGAGGVASVLPEYLYASWLGGGNASSWLYGAAIAPYVTATGASTTVDQVFAQMNTWLSTTTDGEIRGHIYQCKLLGIHPLAYEGGTDLEQIPALNVAVSIVIPEWAC